jgi:hypothetical protein
LFEVCQRLDALADELACERITDTQTSEIASLHAAMALH